MHDVVVIGAGVAGLTAAWRLQSAGLEVSVVEARSRVGGRTWSPLLGGASFDLGATWVWEHETSVHTLLSELAIATFPSMESGDALFDDGATAQRIRRPRSAVQECRVRGGTEAIALALQQRVSSLTLERATRAIEPVDGGVRLVFDDGDVLARHVVAAFPPALLGGEITLAGVDEELVDLLGQTPTWMGDVAKVVAVYDHAFWRDDGLSGCAVSHVAPMVEIHDLSGEKPADGAALFGFVPMAHAQNGDWQERARAQLTRLFGAQASDPIAFRAHAWWTEPETFPQNLRPSRAALFGHPVLRQPLLDARLHLASTETSAVNTGHIDGAARRGEEVAQAILNALRG